MTFQSLFFPALNKKFDELEKQDDILSDLSKRLKRSGRMAVTPCSHYARELLLDIRQKKPDLAERVIGCFDPSDKPNFISAVPTFPLMSLPDHKPDLVLVATTRFYQNQINALKRLNIPDEKIYPVTGIQAALHRLGRETLIKGLWTVLRSVQDQKSMMDYQLVWLAHILMDESILETFHPRHTVPYKADGKIDYHDFQLEHIHDIDCQEELYEEIYRIDEVTPEPGDVAFDIGAYCGDTVAFLERYIGPSGVIYAFEPAKKNIGFLLENIEGNGFKNVIHVPKGVHHETRQGLLADAGFNKSGFFVIDGDRVAESYEHIDMTSLDEFVDKFHIEKINYIKVDIEGCEMNMLKGAVNTIKKFKPKLAISIYHSLEDLINIPLFLITHMPEYKFYIRHRSHRPQSTMLYAI